MKLFLIKSYCLLLISALACFVFNACSTQKNAFPNRAYHNTTARYNGYFNAKESIKEGLNTFMLTYEEDYDNILPIYIIPSEEKASSVYGSMDKAITKTNNVISFHSMVVSGKERCKWIDDNYYAAGIAHFYKREYDKAAQIFSYIIKEYTEKDNLTRYRAQAWLVRTHIENKKLDEAGFVVDIMNQNKEFPSKVNSDRQKVSAAYQIARKNYKKAIEPLQAAIPLSRKKKERIRLTYILAQLCEKAGESRNAQQYYDYVADNSSNYNMAFSAKIAQALAVENRSSTYLVKADLLKMLDDGRNFEYFDQIYYALGEVAFVEKKPLDGVDYFKKSTQASTKNVKQKSKSFLKLAQYYFGQKIYEPAQSYYDSALVVLTKDFPEYDKITELSNNLDSLVSELKVIEREDSLLKIAKLPQEERLARIDAIAKQMQKEADDKAFEASNLLNNTLTPGALNSPAAPVASGSFYFYNVSTKGTGFNDFKKKWGKKRVLEDNWRRANKNQADGGQDGFQNEGSETASANGSNSGSGNSGAPLVDKNKLLNDLPLSAEAKTASSQKIVDALYNSGIIYKEKFKDIESAIESFENMLARFDSTKYEVVAYYQLYRMYLQKENNKRTTAFFSDNKSSSFYYKDLILNEYPNSEFAKLLNENPNKELDKKDDNLESKAYLALFQQYKENNLSGALLGVDSLISAYPTSTSLSRYSFLKARILGDLRNIDSYKAQLSFITLKFPGSPEATEAKRILDYLATKNIITSASDSTTTSLVNSAIGQATAAKLPYVFNESAPHYFLYFFTDVSADINLFKSRVSDFNTKLFGTSSLSTDNSFIDNDNQYILVKTFASKNEAMNYYTAFVNDKTQLKMLNGSTQSRAFVLTVPNFITLFKAKSTVEYETFFKENYLK